MSLSRQYKRIKADCQAAPRNKPRPPLPLIALGAALLTGAGTALATLVYAYTATHPKRRSVWRTPKAENLPYENVVFPSRDGLEIRGWLISAPTGEPAKGMVVLCHGYPYNRTEMLPYALMLHHAGYATLLFDFRAMGESEGDLCSVGYHEVQDLQGALDFLDARPDAASLPFASLGLSLGAAVSLLTAAKDTRLKAVIAEASFPTLRHALNARCSAVLGPMGTTVARPIVWWGRRWFPVAPEEVSPLEAIRHIAPRAVLLIQGQRDVLVNWRDAEQMYEAAEEPRELWLLPNSGHARCLGDEPEEYARRVSTFLQAHLNENHGN